MKKLILLFLIAIILIQPAYAQPTKVNQLQSYKMHHPELVKQFYLNKNKNLFWFENAEALSLRMKFISLVEECRYLGLEKESYHLEWLKNNLYFFSEDTISMKLADQAFTDGVISFCKDVYQGALIQNYVAYDELSVKSEEGDNHYILMGLTCLSSANELEWFVHFLEPSQKEYRAIKQELKLAVDSSFSKKEKDIRRSLNLLRWIKHFRLEKYVVVNAASALVRYYEADTLKLRMKAVVGTTATPTPMFAGYCDAIILYPYWHVPFSIAVKEILPAVKKNRAYLDRRGLQVINTAGKVLDPAKIDWSTLSAKNFPYQFRQSTGCDNALGVIKFNLTDPFSVYMHDTNNKTAFFSGARYFSHGCIRLEKPVELASEFLPGKIDNEFLEACYKNQKPVTMPLEKPLPVFVIYMTAEYDEDAVVHFYKDVYKLLK